MPSSSRSKVCSVTALRKNNEEGVKVYTKHQDLTQASKHHKQSDEGQEGVFDSSISGPVSVHLGASGALQDLAWLRVTKRPVSANIGQLGDRRRIHGWRSGKGGLHD